MANNSDTQNKINARFPELQQASCRVKNVNCPKTIYDNCKLVKNLNELQDLETRDWLNPRNTERLSFLQIEVPIHANESCWLETRMGIKISTTLPNRG